MAGNFDRKLRLPRIHFRVLLHAANMQHVTNGFTSLPKEGVLRLFFSPRKIRRLRPGLNPRTWVPKASTLPLDHRSSIYYPNTPLFFCITLYHIIDIYPIFAQVYTFLGLKKVSCFRSHSRTTISTSVLLLVQPRPKRNFSSLNKQSAAMCVTLRLGNATKHTVPSTQVLL